MTHLYANGMECTYTLSVAPFDRDRFVSVKVTAADSDSKGRFRLLFMSLKQGKAEIELAPDHLYALQQILAIHHEPLAARAEVIERAAQKRREAEEKRKSRAAAKEEQR